MHGTGTICLHYSQPQQRWSTCILGFTQRSGPWHYCIFIWSPDKCWFLHGWCDSLLGISVLESAYVLHVAVFVMGSLFQRVHYLLHRMHFLWCICIVMFAAFESSIDITKWIIDYITCRFRKRHLKNDIFRSIQSIVQKGDFSTVMFWPLEWMTKYQSKIKRMNVHLSEHLKVWFWTYLRQIEINAMCAFSLATRVSIEAI